MPRPAKRHGRFQKCCSCTHAAQLVGHDEPPEVRTFALCDGPVDCDCAFDLTILKREPEPVTVPIIKITILGQVARQRGLEWKTDTDKVAVVAGMKLDDPSNGAWQITFMNCEG